MPVRAGLRAQVGIEYELRPDRTMKRARACWYVGRTTVMVQVLASVYSAWGFALSAHPFVCFTPQRSGASRSTRLASTVTVPAVERCPEQYLTNGSCRPTSQGGLLSTWNSILQCSVCTSFSSTGPQRWRIDQSRPSRRSASSFEVSASTMHAASLPKKQRRHMRRRPRPWCKCLPSPCRHRRLQSTI